MLKKLFLAAFALVIGRPGYALARSLLALVLCFLPAIAWAQAAAGASTTSGPPAWLVPLLAILLPSLLALHPLLQLSKFLIAHTQSANLSVGLKTAALGTSSILASLDHFLEAGSHDFADLALPDKRAAAIKHIEDQAISGALPALSDALATMGKGWVTGQASQAVDAALAKAPAAAVAAVIKAAAQVAPVATPAVPLIPGLSLSPA